MGDQFAKRHDLDGRFWAFVWLYILAIVTLGFFDPVSARFFDEVQEPAPIALQIHVWSFGAWMMLLASQAYFAATQRMKWHRTLGIAMLPLAAVMIWSAGLSEIRGLQRGILSGQSGGLSAITGSYILPFVVLVAFAWLKRGSPSAHKRLILMATASICAGAHLRTFDLFNPGIFWASESYFMHLLIGFGGSMLIICFGMIYDLATRKALHPVYKVGAPILFGWYALAAWAYSNDSYADFARPIIEAMR